MIVVTRGENINRIELSNLNIPVLQDIPNIKVSFSEDYIIIFEGFESDLDFMGRLKFLSTFCTGKVFYVYYNNVEMAYRLRQTVNCVSVSDKSIIDKNLLDYVVYNDSYSKDNLNYLDDDGVLLDIINSTDVEYILDNIKTVKFMGIGYVEQRNEIQNLLERLELKSSELERLTLEHEELKTKFTTTLEGYNHFSNRYNDLLHAYKSCVYSESDYKTVPINSYDNCPRIIYLKVYKELIHQNSFLKSLKLGINDKLQSSCKLVRLVGPEHRLTVNTLPKTDYYYCNTEFKSNDVYANDFIVKGGDYSKLLHFLFQNDLNLGYLVIVDELHLDKDAVEGAFIKFNLCRNKADLDNLRLDKGNTIVNNADRSYLTYNTINSIELHNADDDMRYTLLSSQRAITGILKTVTQVESLGLLKFP